MPSDVSSSFRQPTLGIQRRLFESDVSLLGSTADADEMPAHQRLWLPPDALVR